MHLEHRLAEGDPRADRSDCLPNALAVDVGAVRGGEIADAHPAVAELDLGVAARYREVAYREVAGGRPTGEQDPAFRDGQGLSPCGGDELKRHAQSSARNAVERSDPGRLLEDVVRRRPLSRW